MRRDDGAGRVVAQRAIELNVKSARPLVLALAPPVGDPFDLLWSWDGADLAVVSDATSGGMQPGTLSFAWLARDGEPAVALVGRQPSSHGFGILGAYRVARAVGRGPRQLALVGIEGLDFSYGEGLSAPVQASLPAAARLLLHLASQVAGLAGHGSTLPEAASGPQARSDLGADRAPEPAACVPAFASPVRSIVTGHDVPEPGRDHTRRDTRVKGRREPPR